MKNKTETTKHQSMKNKTERAPVFACTSFRNLNLLPGPSKTTAFATQLISCSVAVVAVYSGNCSE